MNAWRAVLVAAIGAATWSCAHAAPVEANTASQARLEALPGLGVASTERLLQARAEAPFRDWDDLMRRVSGLKQATARRLSNAGLTVNGVPYTATADAAAGAASAAR